MKKIFFVLLINLIASNLLAQDDMKPKSFMFSSMADFTTFPTATATGLPDISLPLFSVATASPDFNLDLKLQYNLIGGINARRVGGQFGNSWNLNIDATIGREVRSLNTEPQRGYLLPDELHYANSNTNRGGYGDIYTYNFFGNTGKFYLKKENGIMKAVIHESNSYVEIKVNYSQTDTNNNAITVEILDVSGKKYIFNEATNFSDNKYYTSSPEGPLPEVIVPHNPNFPTIPQGPPDPVTEPVYTYQEHYGPTFWVNLSLSKVYDKNGNLIAEYEYQEGPMTLAGSSKLLKSIKIPTVGSIEFENSISGSTGQTNNILLKKINNEVINKINFSFQTTSSITIDGNQPYSKKLLTKISVLGKSTSSTDVTEIFYKTLPIVGNSTIINTRGYLQSKPNCNNLFKRSDIGLNGIIQKIKFNTGGSVLYDFERNTYAQSSLRLKDYLEGNLDNYIEFNYELTNTSLGYYTFNVEPNTSKILFGTTSGNIGITRVGESQIQYSSTNNSKEITCLGNYGVMETNGKSGVYKLTASSNSAYSQHFLRGIKFPDQANTYKFLYMDGYRIKKIAYFEGNVNQNLLENNNPATTAEREITYNYSEDGTDKTSSGRINWSEAIDHTRNLDSYVLYEKVTLNVRGIGKTESFFNNTSETDKSWRFLNMLPKKTLTYNNANQLLKEQSFEREYKYFNSELIVNSFDREPILMKEQVRTKEYINNNVADFINKVTYDTIHRNVTLTFKQNVKTNIIDETINYYTKINKTYLLGSSDTYFNGVLSNIIINTYDSNANLRYQEVSKSNQPIQKIGNENTLFNSRGNILEYIQPNGTYVTNVYGYEGTKLVAQLVNVKRSEISAILLNTIATNSNETGSALIGNPNVFFPTYNETGLISNLNSLRTSHPNAFITTYIYNTLVGVKSITDPNGDTQTFEYDNQNRLEIIKDHQGNTLNRYKYNFKN